MESVGDLEIAAPSGPLAFRVEERSHVFAFVMEIFGGFKERDGWVGADIPRTIEEMSGVSDYPVTIILLP